VQSLPGVAAADDFYASFASRGAGFSSVGFYIDGVPTSAPFHTILGSNEAYSLTILNGDVVDSISFVSGGAPARYGDRTGAVLNVETREGNREEVAGRVSLGASGAYATVEGPLGGGDKTSWLVSGRKSYLDYVLDRLEIGAVVLGYYDVTTRLAHHPTPAQAVALTLIHGRSSWNDRDPDIQPHDRSKPTTPRCAGLTWPRTACASRPPSSARSRPDRTARGAASSASTHGPPSGGHAPRCCAWRAPTAWKAARSFAP
jgi:hypothetical protein